MIVAWLERRAARRARAAEDQAGLRGRIAFLEMLAAILLLIPSTGTATFTYFGIAMPLSETGASTLSKGEALTFAVTVGLLVWLAWAFIFALVTRLSGPRLRAGLLAGGLMVAAIAALDSPFAMMALAGGQAAQLSLVEVARSYETMLASATAGRGMLPAFKVQSLRFTTLQTSEIKKGTLSGTLATAAVTRAALLIALDFAGAEGLAKAWSMAARPAPSATQALLDQRLKGFSDIDLFVTVKVPGSDLDVRTGTSYASAEALADGRAAERWCYIERGTAGAAVTLKVELGHQTGQATPVLIDPARIPPEQVKELGLNADTLAELARRHCRFAGLVMRAAA